METTRSIRRTSQALRRCRGLPPREPAHGPAEMPEGRGGEGSGEQSLTMPHPFSAPHLLLHRIHRQAERKTPHVTGDNQGSHPGPPGKYTLSWPGTPISPERRAPSAGKPAGEGRPRALWVWGAAAVVTPYQFSNLRQDGLLLSRPRGAPQVSLLWVSQSQSPGAARLGPVRRLWGSGCPGACSAGRLRAGFPC